MNILIAQDTVSQAADNQQAYNGGLFGGMLPLMLIMFLIMYFIVIRPQRKQQKEFEGMLSNLKKGDRILTRGGIYCVILDFVGKEKQKILVDAGNNTKFHISRSYIATSINTEEFKNKSEDKPKKDSSKNK